MTKKLFWIINSCLLVINTILSVICIIWFIYSIDNNGYVVGPFWKTLFHICPIVILLCNVGFMFFLHPKLFSKSYENLEKHGCTGELDFMLTGSVPSKVKLYKRLHIIVLVVNILTFLIALIGSVIK